MSCGRGAPVQTGAPGGWCTSSVGFVRTLERWHKDFREGGRAGLEPKSTRPRRVRQRVWPAVTAFSPGATTTPTPPRCPGRQVPSRDADSPPKSREVTGAVGYISPVLGANTAAAPSAAQSRTSSSKSRGYASRSSPAPNCSGFTKIDTTVMSVSATDRRSRLRCPSCSAPMVGTRPTAAPRARAASQNARAAATVESRSLNGRLRRRPARRRDAHRRHCRLSSRVPARGPGRQGAP